LQLVFSVNVGGFITSFLLLVFISQRKIEDLQMQEKQV